MRAIWVGRAASSRFGMIASSSVGRLFRPTGQNAVANARDTAGGHTSFNKHTDRGAFGPK